MDNQPTNNFSVASNQFPFLQETCAFLANPQNKNQTLRGLTYDQVLDLAKSILFTINPDLDLDNLTPEKISTLLQELLSQEENLQSIIPQNLQSLISDLETSQNQKKQQQEEVNRQIKAFLEKQKLLQEKFKNAQTYQENLNKIAQEITQTLSQETPSETPIISQSLVSELPIQKELVLQFHKIQTLPPDQKIQEEEKLAHLLEQNLQQSAKSLNLPPEISKKIIVTPQDLPLLSQELSLPPEKRTKLNNWLSQQLTPAFTPAQATKITQTIIQSFSQNLPEIDQKTINKASPAQIEKIQTEIKNAVFIALAENAPQITQLNPNQISQIIATITPKTKEELSKISPLLTTPKEQRIPPQKIVLADTPTQASSIPQKTLSFFASPLTRSSQISPLLIPNEQGITPLETLKEKILKEGITLQNNQKIRNTLLEQWSISLALQGITPTDIDHTIEKLINSGEKPTSPRITELQEIKTSLSTTLKTLPPSSVKILQEYGNKNGQKGKSFVILPSQHQTAILRTSSFNPNLNFLTKTRSFFLQLAGKKTILLPSGQSITVPRLSFITHSLLEKAKTAFFKTTVGQSIEKFLVKLSANSLKALWTSLKTGVKQAATKIASKILVKLGLQAIANTLAPGIGTIIALAAEKIIKSSISLIKKTSKAITTGFGVTTSIMEALTGQREVQEDKTFAELKIIFILFFPIIFVLLIFNKNSTDVAFLQPGRGTLEEEINISPPSEPQCSPSRHRAEEIICILSKGESPCNHFIINENTWNDVSKCLSSSSIPNKEKVKKFFSWFLIPIEEGKIKTLQCIGFVAGVEASFGHNFVKPEGGNARDYINPPPGYIRLSDLKQIQKGDIAVWAGKKYGHVAVVIDTNIVTSPNGDVGGTISIAQSDGYNGVISVRENISLYDPGGYLRYAGK